MSFKQRERKGDLELLLLLNLHLQGFVLLPDLLVALELFEFRLHFLLQNFIVFFDFEVLFLDALQAGGFLLVVKRCATCLLDYAQDLLRLVVDSLGDVTLHDQKVWIVNVEFDAQEQVAHAFLGLDFTVDVALYFVIFDGPRDADLLLFLEARRRELPTAVVED